MATLSAPPALVTVAQVGYTGTDDDRDRWLTARIWLERNDPGCGSMLRSLRSDAIDLRADPPRDFLEEISTFDVVVTHHLWGSPDYSPDDSASPAACSPLHSTEAWRLRLAASGARYIFLFGPHFNAVNLDGFIPGYDAVNVPFHSTLDVFVAGSASGLKRAAEPIGYRDMNRARLAALPELLSNSALDLSYTDATSEDLRALRTMERLKDLRLVGVPVSTAGLNEIAAAHELTSLNLDETGLPAGSLSQLDGLTRLESLSLNHTHIEDGDMKMLSRLADLRWLSLIETKVGDLGLRSLNKLRHLEWLCVVGSRVTAAGVEEFRNTVPRCAVRCDFD